MTPKLTAEQREALNEHPGPVAVEDEQTKRIYYLIGGEMAEALRRQQDLDAIRAGLADADAGRVISQEELDARIRAKYGELPEA